MGLFGRISQSLSCFLFCSNQQFPNQATILVYMFHLQEKAWNSILDVVKTVAEYFLDTHTDQVDSEIALKICCLQLVIMFFFRSVTSLSSRLKYILPPVKELMGQTQSQAKSTTSKKNPSSVLTGHIPDTRKTQVVCMDNSL